MEEKQLDGLVCILNRWDKESKYILAAEPGTDVRRAMWIVRLKFKQLMTPEHVAMKALELIAAMHKGNSWEDKDEGDIKQDLMNVWSALFSCHVENRHVKGDVE